MSINHFSSTDLPEGHWWSHYTMDSPPAQTSSSSNSHPNNPFISSHHSTPRFWLTPLHLYPSAAAPMSNAFDLNNEDDEELTDEHATTETPEQEIPKERLFEKPLTPSDVGKLNRLVIPKQHAEKHFPLNGGSDSGENGLLLGFEDEVGKAWRFRYSYWNSSQSYVLTKGWSRFVKEKRLDAGDIVVFSRHRVDTGRLFIGWRRRNSGGGQEPTAVGSWGRVYYSGQPNYHQIQPIYQPTAETLHAGGRSGVQKEKQKQTTSSAGSGNSKTVRLFGVNLECHATDDSEPSTPVGSPYDHQQQQYSYYSSNHHMDISFSGGGADVYRQR